MELNSTRDERGFAPTGHNSSLVMNSDPDNLHLDASNLRSEMAHCEASERCAYTGFHIGIHTCGVALRSNIVSFLDLQ